MKIVAFNGSPRKEGNTAILLNEVLKQFPEKEFETSLIQLGGQAIRGCIACGKCVTMQNRRCAIESDPINDYIQLVAEADGVIIGSPTYFADVSAETKAFIDRVGMVGMVNGAIFQRKAGAAVIAVRRGGSVHAFDTINHLFQISQMLVVGSSYWNMGYGRNPGEVNQDEEGLQTMQNLGKNMAWLLRCISSCEGKVALPETSMVKRTSFIR
jgi:multimeric flavodoxin WrbA